MKKILTAGISVAMACTITVGALCGCANQTSPDLTEVSATSVDYNADGVYTTRLLVADFSGVTKRRYKSLLRRVRLRGLPQRSALRFGRDAG